jgi:hypothetical protein
VNEQPETSSWPPAPGETEQTVAEVPVAAEPLPEPPAAGEPAVDSAGAAASGGDRPEIVVAAAFAGGLVLARILKRFAD